MLFYSFATSSTLSVVRGIVMIYCGIGLLFLGIGCLMFSLFYINYDWNEDRKHAGKRKVSLAEKRKASLAEKRKASQTKECPFFKSDIRMQPLLDLEQVRGTYDYSRGLRSLAIYPPVKPFHKPYHPQDFRLQKLYM